MKYILGVDAAWTEKEPTGVALLSINNDNSIQAVKIARSYEEFSKGRISWDNSVTGSKPDFPRLLCYCRNNEWVIDLIALDIPLSPERIIVRRECDRLISRHYGKYGASTHSPSEIRPGPISEAIFKQLSEAGYSWNGDANESLSFIEVYPHTTIIEIFEYQYRFQYNLSPYYKE